MNHSSSIVTAPRIAVPKHARGAFDQIRAELNNHFPGSSVFLLEVFQGVALAWEIKVGTLNWLHWTTLARQDLYAEYFERALFESMLKLLTYFEAGVSERISATRAGR